MEKCALAGVAGAVVPLVARFFSTAAAPARTRDDQRFGAAIRSRDSSYATRCARFARLPKPKHGHGHFDGSTGLSP